MFDFLSKQFSSLLSRFSGVRTLSNESTTGFLTTVRDTLLEADVPYDIANAFVAEIRQDVVGVTLAPNLKAEEFIAKVVHDKLLAFLGGQSKEKDFSFQMPATIMMMGLQGSGKTTTIAKLARFITESAQGKKPRILVASVDFYRPAAVKQLEILAGQAGVDFFSAQAKQPIEAAREIAAHKAQGRYDLLILDTAGRLHVDNQMLEELRAIDNDLRPAYKFLVLDAMTGQESLKVAQAFDQAVGFTAGIITKLDSDARGGVAFSFRYALKKPVLFVGNGEKNGDLEPFRPERMAQRMLGMGDMLTLLEQADKKIKQHEQEQMAQAFKKDALTLEDFAQHIEFMRNMGPLSQMMKYVPGAAGLNVSAQDLEKGELAMRQFLGIIRSMTRKERLVPKILDSSRKQRIAQGSGVTVVEVNGMLQRFEQSAQMLKQMKRMGLFK